MRQPIFFLLSLILSFLLLGCANIVPPSGGEKDFAPPVCEEQSPPNFSKNFTASKITLYFDEYVQINGLNDQLIISPPMEEKPTFTVKQKSIEIKLNSPLLENRTYTIYMGDAISDINESNKLSAFSYVFSTGDYIDSLTVKGSVADAFSASPEKEITVVLHKESYDSVLHKERPVYVTKTNETGSFELKNLKDGQYYLFAFEDKNNNLTYEADEKVGFYQEPINPADSLGELQMPLFLPERYVANTLIDTVSNFKNLYRFVFFKMDTLPTIKPLESTTYLSWKSGSAGFDTVWVAVKDSLGKRATFISSKANATDTITVKTNRPLKPKEFSAEVRATKIKPKDTLEVHFSTPVTNFLTDSIKIYEDTVEVSPTLFKIDEENKTKLRVAYAWKEERGYSLQFLDSSFIDFFGNQFIKKSYPLRSTAEKDYGTIELSFLLDEKQHYIIYLLNDKDKVVKEILIDQPTKKTFSLLEPGTYKVKVIWDSNVNSIWDNGNFLSRKQPEQVAIAPQQISLKANWELNDIEINISNLFNTK